MPKQPLMREGLETEKQLAKLAFRSLSVPIKNLFLGLTDIETNLAKSQKMIQESALQQMIHEFEAHIDILLQKVSHAQDMLLDLFRECENRVIQEWSTQVQEKDLAEVAFLLVQLLRKMDSLAELSLGPSEHEMYLELRADHDARSTGPSLFVTEDSVSSGPVVPKLQIHQVNENKYKLYKRTLLTFRQARESFDFLKRRMSNRVSGLLFQKDFEDLQEQSRNAAKARLLLHDLQDKQDRGVLYPGGMKGSTDQWVQALDSKQKAEEKILQAMVKPEEELRAGADYQKHADSFRDLQSLIDRCECEIQKMRNNFVNIRSQITFNYRKEQDRIVAQMINHLQERPIQWKPIQIQELSANMARLERARDLMTKELNTVLQNSNIKNTDVEIISQSIRNGVLILQDTEMQELSRESKTRIDRVLYQVSDAKSKLLNVLV